MMLRLCCLIAWVGLRADASVDQLPAAARATMGKHPDDFDMANKRQSCEHCIKYSRRASDIWSSDQLQTAFFPLGHDGARLRLKSKLAKNVESGKPLKIVVLGGSMTYGAQSDCKWSSVLETLLNSTFQSVEVVNLAKRGSATGTILMEMDTVEQQNPDIILVDYTVNDGFMPNEVGTSNSWVNQTETLVRLMLRMRSQPAVLYLETFTNTFTCDDSFVDSPHWKVLVNYDVPAISYRSAVCMNANGTMPNYTNYQTGWAGGLNSSRLAHPPCSVHQRVAELVYQFFSGLMAEVQCCWRPGGRDHPPEALQAPFPQARCLREPLTRLFSTFLWEDQYYVAEAALLEYRSRFPAVSHQGWELYADVAGKPGWVANASLQSEIQWRVKTAKGAPGAVIMEYLTTYEGIGSAECRVDDGEARTLNGRVEYKASLGKIAIFDVAGGESDEHILRCRTNMEKFKVLNVRSC